MFQSLLKTTELTKRYGNIIGVLSMMQSLVIIHPFPLPQPGGISPCCTSHALPGKNIYTARLSILILSKAYRSKIKDATSNNARLLDSGFVCQKATK
jgi:hypothetical protein